MSKLRNLHIYILCKNKQIKDFYTNASRKFNVNDETYTIKKDCCYLKKHGKKFEQTAFYLETNPNPVKLSKNTHNIGLTHQELDHFISADLFNILIECQDTDKRKYILPISVIMLIFGFIEFISFIL